jgi:hypothetical protein
LCTELSLDPQNSHAGDLGSADHVWWSRGACRSRWSVQLFH